MDRFNCDWIVKQKSKISNIIHYYIASSERSRNIPPAIVVWGLALSDLDYILESVFRDYQIKPCSIDCYDLLAESVSASEAKISRLFDHLTKNREKVLILRDIGCLGETLASNYHDERIINSIKSKLNKEYEETPIIIGTTETSPFGLKSPLAKEFAHFIRLPSPIDVERCDILKRMCEYYLIDTKQLCWETIGSMTTNYGLSDLEAVVINLKRTISSSSCSQSSCEASQISFESSIDSIQKFIHQNQNIVTHKSWSDVGGLQDAKDEILSSILFPIKQATLFSNDFHRRGILLHGPPGTGKTLLAKTIAAELSLNLMTVNGPELLNMYIGQSEQNIRLVFQKALQSLPCLMFFDELDSIAPKRGGLGDSSGVIDRVVSQLITEIDTVQDEPKIIILATTNRIDLVDPALLRPGRFDKVIKLSPCRSISMKLDILQALTKKAKTADHLDLKWVASHCPKDITGADLQGICSAAFLNAVSRANMDNENAEVILENEDFKVALLGVYPNLELQSSN